MQDILELRQKRAALVKQAREILDRAEEEKRDLTAEEEEQYDRIMADVDSLGTRVEREERLARLQSDMDAPANEPVRPEPGSDDEKVTRTNPRATEEYRQAFNSFLRRGLRNLNNQEYRALQADDDSAGGYTVAPEQFVRQLIKAIDDAVYIRQIATVIDVPNSQSLGVPALDTDMDDADWTSELKTGAEDTAMDFGKRELRPYPLAKRIKVSNRLLRVSGLDIEALIRDRLAYKHAVAQEKAFMSGDGSNKPLGLFTASDLGISTARDVSTGNSATEISADGLIEAKYTLKPQYHRNARWFFHRDAIKQIRKLKDSNNQYLWQAGIASGRPDTILDIPYTMSEFVPNTFTAGQYVGIIGDFSYYWIADALDMAIQRLDELYAESNQVGFIGRLECDGMPVLEEAFVRVALASS